MKKRIIAVILVVLSGKIYAQTDKETYLKTITDRAQKIAATLSINDSSTFKNVRDVIRDHYSNLNDIYEVRDASVKNLKQSSSQSDTSIANAIQSRAKKSVDSLHPVFLSSLKKYLNDQQVEQVKNGLTYNVLPITYKAYQDMIPRLTEDQKKQIYAWLIEARENAMDAESSDRKHWWFGKYRGRINNYLSKQGYDIKKEGEEWEKRRKAASR